MASGVMGNSMWHLVQESDTMTWIVLLILLGLSIASWTVFLYKFLVLRIKKRQVDRMIKTMRELNSTERILNIASMVGGNMPGFFLMHNVAYIKSLLALNGGENTLKMPQWELAASNMDSLLDDMITKEESYLSVLSTSAAVSPLLGLFGTVWGLIHAFISISERQSADIATIAPGIAEALITTLFGLMVAIPALVMFNYLAAQVRSLEYSLTKLSDQFGRAVQQFMVR